MKASELKPEGRFFGMFLGRSKSGKTVAAASFPKPMLILDGDLRAEGILGGKNFLTDLDQIDIERFPPAKGFSDFEKRIEMVAITVQARQNKYKTIVLDSVTSMNRMFITDSHEQQPGRKLGNLRLSGPGDYGYEAEACYQIFDYLRGIPLNFIISAHVVDIFGKLQPDQEYSETGKVGEKLSIRDKIGENIQIYFNEVYRFTKEEGVNGHVKHIVQFRSEIAGTCFPELPDGRVDITGKNFYDLWKSYTMKEAQSEKI